MRIAILGNSGSGKSTLARAIAAEVRAPVLDLDTIYWEPDRIAVARDPAAALADLERFCTTHSSWVIEGCYGDLVRAALQYRPKLILLDPGKERCLSNCRARPWEPHKYGSKAEQDAKLAYLLAWVAEYYERDGDLSQAGHHALFAAYDGPKELIS